MQRETYTAKTGRIQFRPVLSEDNYRHLTFNEMPGFCVGCGAETDGVEPDARRYRCGECHDMKVYGLEELMVMGLVRLGEVVA